MPPKNTLKWCISSFLILFTLLLTANSFATKDNYANSATVAVNDFTNFESGANGWVNTNGDVFDWSPGFRTTPSGGTGPQNFGGSDGDRFYFIEATGQVEDDNAYFQKAFDFTNQTNAQISFYYHMYSQTLSSAGRLNVQVSADNGNTFTTISSIIGNQGINWLQRTVDLSDYNGLNVIIRFEGLVGTSFRSDVSLDEILVTSDDNPNSTLEGFSFEDSLDGWSNPINDDFDWINDRDGTPSTNTGPSSASEGDYYMYIETTTNATENNGTIVNNGDNAFFQRAFDLTSQKNASITFDYHMFGSGMGTLNVAVSTNNGTSFTNIFSLSGNQGNRWFTSNLDLDAFEGQNIIIRFEGIKGTSFRSDIAIDNVLVTYEVGVFVDTDGDGIFDNVDQDNDNDGILDIGEQCLVPGAATPEPDRITFIEGDFDIFSIGGNTNGLGYQESGFQEAAFEKGMQLTVLDTNNDFTFPANPPVGGATSTTGTFSNGTVSYSSNAANIATRGNRFFLDNLPGGSGAEAIQILPSRDLVAGETYSVDISLTTPVFAFSFDIIDILDTSANIDPTVVRYEIIADSQLVAYFQSEPLTAGNTRIVEIFDANDVVQGTMLLGHNVESTIGFITSGSAVSNISFVHNVIQGEILQDFHFINKFAWSTSPQSCFGNSLDFDQDGIPNYRDLDSDNDGIPDNIEAQTTIDYIAPNGVYDARGIDTAYPSGIVAVNTDRSGNSDFIDLDSDDDGITDIDETGFTALDTNNDGRTNGSVGTNGLDNSLYTNDDYVDVNADINNPVNSDDLPDIDGDVLTVGDVDYRDTHLSGTPLITQILQTPTDRVIEITNIHPTNPILANTIRLSLFKNTNTLDQTGIIPDAISSITSPLLPGSSILLTSAGSVYSGVIDTQITDFSDSNDILLLTHPGSITQANTWKNRYETTFEILNNTSFVRSDETETTSRDFTSSEWITFVDESLDPYRDLADGGPERHPHAPLTSEIGVNANPDSNTSFGVHRTGPTSMIAGNWTNGFPDRTRRVQLPEDYVSNSDINAKILTISNGSKLTMRNNSLLVVTDDINISGNNDQIRLAGASQLIQTHTGTSKVSGAGSLHTDQNSEISSVFRYNYMSSPVVSTGNSFTLEDVLKDGSTATSSTSPIRDINFVGGLDGSATSPISIASEWIYTFASADGILSNWIQKLNTNTILNTDGFTIKGPGVPQNYTFVGTPNDGTLNTNIGPNQFYLLGNPFPSALSVQRFIEDNTNSINGTLYFWQHAGIVDEAQGHSYTGYIGGYSTRNIAMGVAADATSSASGFDFNLQAENALISGATTINDLGTESVLITSPGQSVAFNRIGRGVDTLRVRYRSLISKDLDLQINGNTVSTINFPIQTNYNTLEIPICVEHGNSFSLVSNTVGNINIDYVQLKDIDGQISCSFQTTGTSFVFTAPQAYVPIAQGFFTEGSSTGGPIVFNNSQREFIQEGGGQSVFLKSKNKTRKLPILKLGLEYDAPEDRRAHRQIGISFNKNNSFDYDNGYDSRIFDLNATDMYWKFPSTDRETRYVIAGVGAIDDVDLIPLEIIVDTDKEITIQIDEWNIDNQDVFIYDKLTEEYHSLNNNEKSILNLSKGVYSDRFFMTFQEKQVLNTEDNILKSNVYVFYDDSAKEISIDTNDNTSIEKAELYTILGKKIQSWDLKAKDYEQNRLPVKINNTQLTIIKLYTNKGNISKKILIK